VSEENAATVERLIAGFNRRDDDWQAVLSELNPDVERGSTRGAQKDNDQQHRARVDDGDDEHSCDRERDHPGNDTDACPGPVRSSRQPEK
jgi:hypothetical protein